MKKIYFGGPSITNLEKRYVLDSVTNGFYGGMKKDLTTFETKLKKLLKINYVHLTFTCTHALHLALLACGIKKGDEVIIPEISWIATAQAAAYTNARCVFVDIDPYTLCIDPKSIESAITKKTKAVMVVHSFGHPCNMIEIVKICKKHNLFLVEDAAPSLGSHINGKMTGTFGDIGCFSFQGSKIITTNEGGAFVTNSKKKFDFAKLYSILGRTDSKGPFWSDHIAFRYGMSNLNASLGSAQVQRIKDIVKIKRDIAKTYIRYFENNKYVRFIEEPAYGFSNYGYPNIILKKPNKKKRDKLVQHLLSKNIFSRPMFPLMSDMPMFKRRFENPNSRLVSENTITLPSPPQMTSKDISRVFIEIMKFFKKNKH
jgi:perosamine synthetase